MCGLSGQLERLVVLICCWAACSHAVSADRAVFFADPNLKAAVEEKLAVYDPNATDMLGLTDLHAYGKGIEDLRGIEYAKNLTNLSLPNNQISDISVLSNLNNLETLHLYHNRIEDVSILSRFTKLKELSLDDNQICDISAVAGLRNLTRLSASYNAIVDISALSELANLTQLFLSHNQIYDVAPLAPLFGLEKLEGLEVSYNKHNDIRFGSGLTHLSFMEALDKNADFLNDPNIETIRERNPFGFAPLIASNIEEHITYIMEKPGGFEELRRVVIEKLQDYPKNPRGKYYLKKGLGAYFIVHDRVIGYFLEVRGYDSPVWFLFPRSQDPARTSEKRMAAPGHPSMGVFSQPNADIFEVNGSLYMFTWAYMTGTGSFPMLSLWTIKDGRMAELESPEIVGYFESYDFDNRVLYTIEMGDWIKQERGYKGGGAVYDVAYFVNDKIEKAFEECANPWYLVLKDFLEAIWRRDIEKAKQFVMDADLLDRSKNYRYCDPTATIYCIEEGVPIEDKYTEKEIKTVHLHYGSLGDYETFDFCEFDGRWKIIDIREM